MDLTDPPRFVQCVMIVVWVHAFDSLTPRNSLAVMYGFGKYKLSIAETV